MSHSLTGPTSAFFPADAVQIAELSDLVCTQTDGSAYPMSSAVSKNVVLYDAQTLTNQATDDYSRTAIRAEFVSVLSNGPGIVVLQGAFGDLDLIDRINTTYFRIIDEQRSAGHAAGDHYAKPGANDRVWNALEKLAAIDPEAFVAYYGNETVALVCEAWLGPGYQMTSQLNVVNPGGEAQRPHRDYPLGYPSFNELLSVPIHTHLMAPHLTLQGAVAHCDMALESGPTTYLPHSQKLPTGYLGFHLEEVQRYYAEHSVQLPLKKGDAVFFNPAVIHAAGTNQTSNIKRIANLLQVASPFARAMETVDRDSLTADVYEALASSLRDGSPQRSIRNALACAAEGFSFPTNLDLDAPLGGIAPATSFDSVWASLLANRSISEVQEMLQANALKRRSN